LNANNLHLADQHGSSAMSEGRPGRRSALAPVGRETLHERVYAELRRSLIHGVFEAGQVLRIVELAETLQTSTMPVREALARLVSEQALEALPNRSVRVPLVTRERLDDLALARPLIEEQLVALALPNLSKDDFKELRRLTLACEAAFKSDDPDKARTTSELNHAFHFYIYQAAGSAVLIPIDESAGRCPYPRRKPRHTGRASPLGADRSARTWRQGRRQARPDRRHYALLRSRPQPPCRRRQQRRAGVDHG
jgi:DNA-binding GntR family transcriptional regulator